jgi:hypothetical protein
MPDKKYKNFAALFNSYRLKAGYETLVQFAAALSEEGYAYEDSIFSRWKNGDRIPRNRKVILAVIKLFIKRGVISSKKQVNNFLLSLDQRDLTDFEAHQLFTYQIKKLPDIILHDNMSLIYYSTLLPNPENLYLKN